MAIEKIDHNVFKITHTLPAHLTVELETGPIKLPKLNGWLYSGSAVWRDPLIDNELWYANVKKGVIAFEVEISATTVSGGISVDADELDDLIELAILKSYQDFSRDQPI